MILQESSEQKKESSNHHLRIRKQSTFNLRCQPLPLPLKKIAHHSCQLVQFVANNEIHQRNKQA